MSVLRGRAGRPVKRSREGENVDRGTRCVGVGDIQGW